MASENLELKQKVDELRIQDLEIRTKFQDLERRFNLVDHDVREVIDGKLKIYEELRKVGLVHALTPEEQRMIRERRIREKKEKL